MEHDGILVSPGSETRIAMRPMLSYNTADSLANLSPEERQCYQDHEVDLKYVSRDKGYHYDMNNCLFNFALDRILTVCKCRPIFLPSTGTTAAEVPYCTGKSIVCMYDLMADIGGNESSVVIGTSSGGSATPRPPCYSRCNYQEHFFQISSTRFPQRNTFYFHRSFCSVADRLRQGPCQNSRKKFFVDLYHPGLCDQLQDRAGLLGTCSTWPKEFLFGNSEGGTDNVPKFEMNASDARFVNSIREYSRENLAQIKVLFRSPYVQSIKRDLEMTFTGFVANTGGLLGLCMGFSFVSFFELLYHCIFKR